MPSLFQRRHYEWLAAFCRVEREIGNLTTHATIHLAQSMQADNSNFNYNKFMQACEPAPREDGETAPTVAQIRKQQREARRIRRVGYP